MADKRIDQLTAATTMGDDDLLVLQQNNQAKKLSGATLSDYIYDVVEVSNTEPVESRNKVWIKPSTEDLVLAEQSDVDELKAALTETTALAYESYTTNSASGVVASFTDGGNNILAKNVIIEIEPAQAGSGDPSPTNVRAMSGWTGANISHTVKNLCGGKVFADAIKASISAATINTTAKTVSFSAGATVSHHILGTANNYVVHFKEDTQYTFILTVSKSSNANINFRINYTDGTYTALTQSGTAKETKAYVSTAGKTVLSFQKQNVGGTSTVYYDECGVFEGVLTVQDFEAYKGNVTSISWQTEAGTVYGGNLNIATGVLTVTHANIASYNGETINEPWISSMDVFEAGTTPTTGAQVVYPVTNPTTYEIDTSEIEFVTFYGYNNFWTDTGDIYISYKADNTLYAKSNPYNPDQFYGTDTEKLQACFDRLANVGGSIVINREYVLTGNVVIKNNSEKKRWIHVIGIGENAKISCGQYRFTAPTSGHTYGGIFWSDINFKGTGVCFDVGLLIRLFFTNCFFNGFSKAFSADQSEKQTGETNRYIQTLYMSHCAVKGGNTGIYISGNGAYDLNVHDSLFEQLTYAVNCTEGSLMGVNITSNVIEAIWATGIYVGGNGTSLSIENNYFEGVPQHIYFKKNLSHKYVSIKNNYFIPATHPAIFFEPNDDSVREYASAVISGNTFNHSGNTDVPSMTFTSSPQIAQVIKLENNFTPLLLGNDNGMVVANSKSVSSADLDNTVVDGTYVLTDGILVVTSASNMFLQVKYPSDGTAPTSRVKTLSGTWSSWI